LAVYKLTWDDFCAWYLEIIKPEFGKPIDQATYAKTIGFFETILKLLHPFMPFITEELWRELGERKEMDCIIVAPWPGAGAYDRILIENAATAFEVVAQIRNTRNAKGLSPKDPLELTVLSSDSRPLSQFAPIIKKMANLGTMEWGGEKSGSGASFVVGSAEFFIPLKIDKATEQLAIRKELDYVKGFLASIDKKLSNEKFVAGAPPQVLELERKKKADAEMKMTALEKSLKDLE
jgi:valyl-tRNA synthetase